MSNAFTTERNANLPTGINIAVDIQAGHVMVLVLMTLLKWMDVQHSWMWLDEMLGLITSAFIYNIYIIMPT